MNSFTDTSAAVLRAQLCAPTLECNVLCTKCREGSEADKAA